MTSSSEEHDRLREEIAILKAEINELEVTIDTKDADIGELKARVDMLEDSIQMATKVIYTACGDLEAT